MVLEMRKNEIPCSTPYQYLERPLFNRIILLHKYKPTLCLVKKYLKNYFKHKTKNMKNPNEIIDNKPEPG